MLDAVLLCLLVAFLVLTFQLLLLAEFVNVSIAIIESRIRRLEGSPEGPEDPQAEQ